MFKFGAASKKEMANVDPRLILVANYAIELTTQDFGIYDGDRTEAEQRINVKTGVSQTMKSKHRSDLQPDKLAKALDVVPWINGRYRWEERPCCAVIAAFRFAAIALGVKLRWGACWDRTLNDLPAGAEALYNEAAGYAARRRAAGKKALLDWVHVELA